METLLIVAIIFTTLAVVAQAGALLAMYVMSRRTVENVNGLVNESHKLVAPLEHIAANLKTTSGDFVEIGKNAREEFHRVETFVHEEIQDLRTRINDTADEVQGTVLAPFREWR